METVGHGSALRPRHPTRSGTWADGIPSHGRERRRCPILPASGIRISSLDVSSESSLREPGRDCLDSPELPWRPWPSKPRTWTTADNLGIQFARTRSIRMFTFLHLDRQWTSNRPKLSLDLGWDREGTRLPVVRGTHRKECFQNAI
jgi:hypothetical protein